MKKTLLVLLSSLGIISYAGAQIEIYVNGGATDVSGTTIQISPSGPGTIVSDFHVVNSTGTTKVWGIKRVRVNEQPTWSDYLCWGHETDPFGGQCYSATTMDQTTWTTPGTDAVTVADGEGGTLQSDITPDENAAATVTYCYYVMNGNVAEDSVFVEVSFSASTPKITPQVSVNVAPNPASESVVITTGVSADASVKILDVLGNVVYKETVFTESKTINVAEFKNGVYFVIIDIPGIKTLSRKVIVRH